MSTMSSSNAHRPHGYAEEARDWLVEYMRERDPNGEHHASAVRADLFLAEAWCAGFKLVPLDEHDLDIGRAVQ